MIVFRYLDVLIRFHDHVRLEEDISVLSELWAGLEIMEEGEDFRVERVGSVLGWPVKRLFLGERVSSFCSSEPESIEVPS